MSIHTATVYFEGSTFLVDFRIPRIGEPIEEVINVELEDRDDDSCPVALPDDLPDDVYDQILEAVSEWARDCLDDAQEWTFEMARDC